MKEQIIINIINTYDRRGRKIVVNLSDGNYITRQEKFFNHNKAIKYINTLMAEGYTIEPKYSQSNYETLVTKST
jgi:hypothetical protein